MSIEANKALVSRYYFEVLNNRNLAVLDEIISPSFLSRMSNNPDAGIDQYRAAVMQTHSVFPDLVVTIKEQVAEGDRVVTRWIAHATHQGAFAGIPATGKKVVVTAIHIHRIENRKLAELWEEINLFGLLQQIQS
jgi:steroid delta-isomerase-like uncharacterized protein